MQISRSHLFFSDLWKKIILIFAVESFVSSLLMRIWMTKETHKTNINTKHEHIILSRVWVKNQ